MTGRLVLEQAHQALRAAVRGVDAAGLRLPTPCEKWDVAQVLQHAVGDQLAFAAFLTGGPGPTEDPFAPSGELGDEPGALLESALTTAAAAWADVPADAEEVRVPVPPNTMSPALGLGACALDAAVHAWDIAVALGRPSPLTADLAGHLLPAARQIVEPLRNFGAYAPELEPAADPAGAPAAEGPSGELLRYLGRRPDWSPLV
ncbi:TIGR03086 family metal-binding protein [Streptomyces sp. NPDC006992]|uniref:TIGR03086 family metal-binding protein n=1 Tax=unclassified Streptomyces TaxID=2593676 RepID=UPI0033DFE199